MLKEDLAKFNYDLREGSLVAVAAKIYGCGVSDLLSWSEKDDGSVVIIAPTGQKFTYSADEIMKKILEPTGLACAGTGAVIRTEADMVTPIASDSQTLEPGGDRVAKGEVPVAGDGLTQSVNLVTETPDPGAGHDTKKDEEMVTPLATAAAAPVTSLSQSESATPKRRSTRRRTKKAEPDK
jgi:hypothetical protein